MTDPDFDDFAELWRQPGTTEEENIEGLARKARRRAGLLGYADLALGGLLVAITLVGTFMKPEPITGVIALSIVAATVWVSWKRRALRQMSLGLDTDDRHSFFEIAIRHATANLRRLSLTLWFLPAFILLAVMFKLSYRNGGRLDHPLDTFLQWSVSPRGIFTIVGVAIVVAFINGSRRRTQAELRKLGALQRNYREEATREDAAAD